MNKQFWKESLGWGAGLWLFGYVLGIVLFMLVPPAYLGWVIMPFGIAATWWVLQKKISKKTLEHFIGLGLIWTILAIVLDYFLLVKVFKPTDGYYKLDVYLYYLITFAMPVMVGMKKAKKAVQNKAWMILGLLALGVVGLMGIKYVLYLDNAHSSFAKYYKFRGCTELIQQTDSWGTCKNAEGKTIKIVLFQGKWYLDGDLPCGFLCL